MARASQSRSATSVNVQRVRFKRRPFFTLRRSLKAAAYVLPAGLIAWYFLIYHIDSALEGLDDDILEDEEDEEGEGLWFLPLSLPKKLPQEYWKGSDPEWQAILRFHKDSKRHIAVQKELISMIRNMVSRMPAAKSTNGIIGPVDVKKGRNMLTIFYPDGPPQLYEISGIAITDDQIAWAKASMTNEDYLRHRTAIWPTAAFWSFYESSKFQVKKQWKQAKEALDWDGTSKKGDSLTARRTEQGQQAGKGGSGKRQQHPSVSPLPPEQPYSTAQADAEPDGTDKPKPSSAPKAPSKVSVKIPLSLFVSTDEEKPKKRELPLTWITFWRTFGRTRSSEVGAELFLFDVPRGCIEVSGSIEVVGANGTAELRVRAAYDLNASRFAIVKAQQLSYKPRIQRPKGGN